MVGIGPTTLTITDLFNSLALMTLEKLVILKVVRMGAMNLALQPSARCINI